MTETTRVFLKRFGVGKKKCKCITKSGERCKQFGVIHGYCVNHARINGLI